MDKSYIEGLIKAKDIAKKMADEHNANAEEAFNRLKTEFYPIPYSEHTEEQKEERRLLQQTNNIECGKSIVLFDLVNTLWAEILKADMESRKAV